MRKPRPPFLDSIYEEMFTERYAMVTINAYLYLIKLQPVTTSLDCP